MLKQRLTKQDGAQRSVLSKSMRWEDGDKKEGLLVAACAIVPVLTRMGIAPSVIFSTRLCIM